MLMDIPKRKFIVMSMAIFALIILIVVSSAACIPFKPDSHENPRLQWQVFERIGREGIMKKVTLDQLQGDYTGNIRFRNLASEERLIASQLLSTELECLGKVAGNLLIITLTLPDGEIMELHDLPLFELDDGIITAPVASQESTDESDFEMVCVVKRYPQGLMIDGELTKESWVNGIHGQAVTMNFQLIK